MMTNIVIQIFRQNYEYGQSGYLDNLGLPIFSEIFRENTLE